MVKQLPCREHGGTFSVEARRGRPPVRCTSENPCTKIVNTARNIQAGKTTPRQAGKATPLSEMTLPELKAYAHSLGMSTATRLVNATQLRNAIRKYQTPKPAVPESAPEAPAQDTPSVAKAHAAKELLKPQGWHCSARKLTYPAGPDGIELTATRHQELLTLVWRGGNLVSQNYTLWDTMKPAKNNMPAHRLPFDPDELPDRELIQRLSGMKVTWWNRIASSEETAIVSADKISITHAYNGTGDEMPGDRVITFVDPQMGFRSFRAGALLKIGK